MTLHVPEHERFEDPPTASRLQRLAERMRMTEGQLYTVTIGLVVGLALALASVPNIEQRGPRDELSARTASMPASGESIGVVNAPASTVAPRRPTTPSTTASTEPQGRGHPTSAGGAGAASGTPTPTTTAPEPPPLGHSDRGVSAETIEIAFLFDVAEFAGSDDPDAELSEHRSHAQFWVDHLNAEGGVGGRSLAAAFSSYDSRDPASVRKACIDATAGREVFWATASGAAPAACVADEHRTLFSTSEGLPAETYVATAGRALTWGMAGERQLGGQVDRLHGAEKLAGRTIGVVYSDRPVIQPAVEHGLLPRLEDLGYDVAATVVLSPDESEADLVSGVATMAIAGVDLVFLVAPADRGLGWVQGADHVGFTPQYVLSDIGRGVLQDLEGYPASFQAIGDSWSSGRHDWNAGRSPDLPAVFEECRRRYLDATGTDVAFLDTSDDGEVALWRALMAPCRELLFFAAVAEAVGPDLTADRYRSQAGQMDLDQWTLVGSTFGPDKSDGANDLRPVRWQRRCPRLTGDRASGCWTPTGPFSTVRS